MTNRITELLHDNGIIGAANSIKVDIKAVENSSHKQKQP